VSQQRSSCASTDLPVDNAFPAVETIQQCYPVDDITQRTPCELQIQYKGLINTVAYATAMPIQPGEVYLGQPTPARYARVGVEEVSDPGPRDCAHGIEYSRIRVGACHIPYICCKVLGYE
jgi:hypothetical protein